MLSAMQQGTRVEVKRDASDSLPYLTTVGNVLEDGRVMLDVIRMGGEEMRLIEGTSYVVRFFTERGVFKYASTLLGYEHKGEFEFMLFQTTGDGEKMQRRQSYRLACGLDTEFNTFDDAGAPASTEVGFIRDISSGGIRLLSNIEMNVNNLLQIKIPIIDDYWAYGTLLSKNQVSDANAKFKWQYGVEFMGMSDAYTEKITKFVLAEQQKARARK
ncbi:MAG: flagellar brake protein [Defluviitaleaceae bacterium]|nr:flagellar brake protein [Defluviitaleaceae bacterium]